MRLQIKGKQVDITPPLQSRSQKPGWPRSSGGSTTRWCRAQLVLSREKNRFVAELTVHARGDHILHGIGNTAALEHLAHGAPCRK